MHAEPEPSLAAAIEADTMTQGQKGTPASKMNYENAVKNFRRISI